MTQRWAAAAFIVTLGACANPPEIVVKSMEVGTDLTQQTIGSAICSRGNVPIKMLVNRDGSAVGRFEGSQEDVATGSMIATGPQTVVLKIERGPAADEDINETLKPVRSGGRVLLRGESFDCWNVKIR